VSVTVNPQPPIWSRLLAALPDAAVAAVYACTWVAPFYFGPDTVKNLMMLMLLEFLVVHSGAFIGLLVLSDTATRKTKTLAIVGFGSFYMMFAAAFSLAFKSWWPALSFFWLLAAKFSIVWLTPLPRDDEAQRLKTLWLVSVVFYLGAVFAGVLLPLPRLGLNVEVVTMLHLPGEGLWIEQPHTVVVSGMLYFAACAWSKWAYRPGWGMAI
jgi:hypothetical protein